MQTSVQAEASGASIVVTAGKRPLVPAAFYMMLGILAAAYLPLPLPVYLLALLAAAIATAILYALKINITLLLLASSFLAGSALLTASLPAWAADPWAPAGIAEVRGRVVRVDVTSGGYWQFTLDGVTVGGEPVDGRVLVTAKGANDEAGEGDTLQAAVQLERPEPSRYYGDFNARGWYLRRGIRFTAFAVSPGITGSDRGDTVWDLPRRARKYAEGLLYRYLGPDSAALVSALLSGDKSGIPDDISDSFINLGAAHLLAVSGLNISLTAGAAWLLCRKLKIPMPISFALSFLVMVSYVLFAGLTPSVERAAVMWAAMMGGMAAARRYDPLSSISAAAIVILALSPLDLFDAGFQLSFLATAAMFLWLAPVMRHAPETKWMKALAGAAGVTIVVTVMALPVILACFHSVSLTSPLANLVLVPASFILQLAGTAMLLTGFLPGIPGLMGTMLDGASKLYLSNVRLLDWSGATFAAAIPPVWLSAVFTLLVFAVSPSLVRLGRGMRIGAAFALAAAVGLMLAPLPSALTGRGDTAIVAEKRQNVSVYWEAGGKRYAACGGSALNLSGYLKGRGVARLDGLYIVRPKPPGDGSLLAELDGTGAECLYVPDDWLADPAASAFLRQGLALGMEPRGAGGDVRGDTDILSLALPGELAGYARNAYNITDCGSVEIWNRNGKTAFVPWRNGWEDGLQGNFR